MANIGRLRSGSSLFIATLVVALLLLPRGDALATDSAARIRPQRTAGGNRTATPTSAKRLRNARNAALLLATALLVGCDRPLPSARPPSPRAVEMPPSHLEMTPTGRLTWHPGQPAARVRRQGPTSLHDGGPLRWPGSQDTGQITKRPPTFGPEVILRDGFIAPTHR